MVFRLSLQLVLAWFFITFPLLASEIGLAERALDDRMLAIAENRFEEVLEQESDVDIRARAFLGLARIALMRGKAVRSQEWLDQIPVDAAPMWVARGKLVGADAALQSGDPVAASQLLSTAGEAGSAWEALRIRLQARTDAASGDLEQALESLQAAGSSVEFVAERARLLAQADRISEASALWQDLASEPIRSRLGQEARLALARDDMAADRWKEAGERLSGLMDAGGILEPLEAQAYPLFVEWYAHQGDYAKAVATLQAMESGLESSDALAQIQLQRVRYWMAAGEFSQARELMQTLVATQGDEPEAAEVQLLLAKAFADVDDWVAARSVYETYLSVYTDPKGRVQAWKGLAEVEEKQEAWDAAGQAYAQAAASLPEDSPQRAELVFKQADMAFAAGKKEEAFDGFESFIARYPSHPLAPRAKFHAAVALARTAGSSLREPERRLRRLRLEHPDSPFAEKALLQIAILQQEALRLEQSLGSYTAYLNEYPEGRYVVDAMVDKGIVSYRIGFFKAARVDFEEVIQAYPDHPRSEQARCLRGWTLYLMGEDAEARRVGQAFLKDNPDSEYAPDVRLWLASMAFNQGEFEEAENAYLALADMNVASVQRVRAVYLAGRAALARKAFGPALGNFNRVLEEADAAAEVSGQAVARYQQEALFFKGDALTEMDRFDEAILTFEQFQNQYPDSRLKYAALGRMGDSQYTLGAQNPERYQEALNSYRQVAESATGQPEVQLQALYKQGRTLDALGRVEEALDVLQRVMDQYLQERHRLASDADVWFVRAVTDAAQQYEEQESYRLAVSVYRSLAGTDLPQAAEARRRIRELRETHELYVFEGEVTP